MTSPSEAVEIYSVKRKDRTASEDIKAGGSGSRRGVRRQEVPHRRHRLTDAFIR